MRRVNLRFLLATIVIVAMMAGAVHGVHTLQYKRHAAAWRESAEQAQERGDTQQQITYLRRLMALDKSRVEDFESLGTLLMESNRFAEAQLPLATALSEYEAKGQTEDALRMRQDLVKVALKSGRWSDVDAQLDKLIDESLDPDAEDPAQAKYREQRATCRMAAGLWNDAARELERAIRHDRTRCEAYELLAQIEASELNQPASAVERLHTMVARNSGSASAYRIRSGFRLQHASDLPVSSAEAAQLLGGSVSAMDAKPLPPLEMVKLAAADAKLSLEHNAAETRALQDATKNDKTFASSLERKAAEDKTALDLAMALELAMRCAHLLSALVPPEQSQQHLDEASRVAESIIKNSQADLDRRVADYKSKHANSDNAEATDDSPPPGDTDAAQDPEVPLKMMKQLTREAFAKAVGAYNVLADLQVRSGKPEEAVRLLSDALTKVENDETLVLNLLTLKLSLPGQGEDVDRLISVLGQQRRTKPLHDYMQARQLIARGQWRTALSQLESLLPSLENWPQAMQDAKLSLANCQMQNTYIQVAERLYREVRQANPLSLPATWGLALALDQQGRDTEALPLYMEIVEARGLPPADPSFPEMFMRVMHAMIASNVRQPPEQQNWEPALALLATARAEVAALEPQAVSPAVLDILDVTEAELFVAREDPESAVQLLSAASARNPQSMAIWLALIAVYDSQAQWDRALETMQQAHAAIGSDQPAKVAQLKLSEGLHQLYQMAASLPGVTSDVRNARLQQANAEIVTLIDSLPPLQNADPRARTQYISVLQRFGSLCLTLRDSKTCAKIYEQAVQLDPDNLQLYAEYLELALHGGNVELAERLVKEIERLDDRKGPTWNFANATLLAIKAEDEKREAVDRRKLLVQAEASLRVAENAWPGRPNLRRLRSHVFRRQDRLTEAVDLDLQTFRNGFVQPEFLSQLVRDLYELNRYDDAAEVLANVDQNAGAERLRLASMAFQVSSEVNNVQQSQELRSLAIELSRANADESADFRSRLAHGVMLLRGEDPAGARAEFEAARDMAPSEAEPWIALVELDVREGKIDSANQTLERAEQEIREADRAIALARGYELVKNQQRAEQYLKQALDSVPADLLSATPLQIQILARAAEAYLQRAQQEEANSRRLAAEAPDESARHRQLAIAFDQQGIALLERIIKDGGLTLTKLETDAAAREVAGDQSDALRKLLSNQIPVVRRRLALSRLAKGGAENREQARQLVDENRLNGEFRGAEDARLYAIIMSQSPSVTDKALALSEIRKLLANKKSSRDEDRLLAATLLISEYRRLGGGQVATGSGDAAGVPPPATSPEARRHLEEARTLMREIVVTNESRIKPSGDAAEPAVSATYVQALVGLIEILLSNGEKSDAEYYIGRLTQVAPESQTTMAAVSTLHFEKGEVDSAIDAVRRFAEAGPDEDRAGRRFAASQLVESFGVRSKDQEQAGRYFAAAEQLLTELSAGDRNGELLLAGFRARRGRTDEAIAAIESSATTASDVQLSSASVHAMRAAGLDMPLLDRLTGALEVGLGANPKSVPLRLMLADLHTWSGRADAAEAMYREVLAANPKHGAAANNLAFLLASQRRNMDEALALINGVISEQGSIAELLDTRAYVQIHRGKAQKAVDDLTKALEASSQPTYLYHLVEARVALKQMAEATETWKLAETSGLSESTLHPLEREQYRALKSQVSAN